MRLLLIHGAGGHVGALWPLVSLLSDDVDITAVDLPLYGHTTSPDPAAVRYGHWLDLLQDLLAAEDDGRPVVLFGASIGGMLAYETAARTAGRSGVAAVAATCLLDPRDWRVRARLTRFGWLGLLSGPLLPLVRGRLARVMVPLRWLANLKAMSRNPALSRLCARDPLGGGGRVPLGFLASFMQHRHVAPQTVTAPVLLVHPGRDAWTPVELSMRTLGRASSSAKVVLLRECGHFPVEEPGVNDLLDALEELLSSVAGQDVPAP